MLSYNEITQKKIIVYENEPCEILESHVARTQQRKPQNQVKLKSLLSGRTWTATFHTSDMVEEADVFKRDLKFLYQNKGEFWFCPPEDPKNRFKLEDNIVGEQNKKFIKDNLIVTAVIFENKDGEEKIIGINLPVKMEMKVKDAPPNIKGNTASGSTKPVTLETGAVVNTPFFVEIGDIIIVNTDTGEYVERAK